MSGIVQQLPALIGVAVGALASYLAGAASERARWRREQSARWDDRRAQAYADYGYVVKNVYVQCMRAAAMRSQTGGDRVGYNEALAELSKLTDERTAKWESVLLLGNPETIAAARTWHRRVWQLERFARGERTDTDQWDVLVEDVIADRARFYVEARRDLGIVSGEIPADGPWEPDAISGTQTSVAT
jgi:adenylate kinase family enzyme